MCLPQPGSGCGLAVDLWGGNYYLVLFPANDAISRASQAPWLPARIQRSFPEGLGFLIGAAIVPLVFLSVLHGYYPVDDTYIALHNATVVWSGVDSNFSGASPLEGTTSNVYLALLVVFLPLFHENSPAILGAAACAAYIAGVSRFARLEGLGITTRWAMVFLAILSGLMPLHLMNGLETSLAVAVVTWLLCTARSGGSYVGLGALAGLAPFVRPELGVLSLLLVTLRVIVLVRAGSARHVVALVGAVALAALPWAVWSLLAGKGLIPGTVAIKVVWFAEYQTPVMDRFHALLLGLAGFVTQLGPVVLAAAGLMLFSIGRAAVVFASCFYGVAAVFMPSGLTQYDGRYQYVLVPILLASLMRVLRDPHAWLRHCGAAVAVASVVFAMVTLPEHWAHFVRPYDLTRYEMTAMVDWCREHVPPGDPILAHDVGFLSYQTDFRLVDMVGLKTEAAARRDAELIGANGVAGREFAITATARASNVRFLVVRNGWDAMFAITDSLRHAGWSVNLEKDWGFYSIYSLSPTW